MVEGPGRGRITVEREDGVWVVAVIGEHDVATEVEFRAALDSLFEPELVSLSRPTLVLVDLSQAVFLDSTILAAILRVHETTRDNPDAKLAVLVGSDESFTARALRVVGFTRVVPTFTDRRIALNSLINQRDPLP